MTDAKGNTYHFGYDLLDRKTSMTYPDNSQEQWSYDPVGNLSSYTNRAGSVESFAYDNRNRLTSSTWNDGVTPSVSYSYDPAGNLLSQNSSVSNLSYTYDNANERTSETQNIAALGSAQTISYSYDADGNRAGVTYPDGTALTYSYTGRNQLAAVSDGAGSVAAYTYDANGNRTGKTLAGVTTAYSYDADSRLLTLNHTFSATSAVPSQNFTYTLNSVGDRTSRKEALGAVSSTDNYSYDAIDQVTSVSYGLVNGTVAYNYDAVGNRTSVTDSVNGNTSYTTNNLNQYTNIAAQVPQYDANGNLTNINGWTYTYDAQNRLLSANNGNGTSETFGYDPQNRCVSRTLTINNQPSTTYYVYDGWELIEELDSSGNELANYVSGLSIDELLQKVSASGIVYFHHDALGSTTALTDANGNLVERYTYDAFGKPSPFDVTGTPLTASAYGNRFLFTGREYLSALNLYDYRNRVYSAELGRFLQIDPMRLAAHDVNIYRYVWNDVVNWTDSRGLYITYDKGDYTGFKAHFADDWEKDANFRKNWEDMNECPTVDFHYTPDSDPERPTPTKPGDPGFGELPRPWPQTGNYADEQKYLRALKAYLTDQEYGNDVPDDVLNYYLNPGSVEMQNFKDHTIIVKFINFVAGPGLKNGIRTFFSGAR